MEKQQKKLEELKKEFEQVLKLRQRHQVALDELTTRAIGIKGAIEVLTDLIKPNEPTPKAKSKK